jgi:hypothetical protein
MDIEGTTFGTITIDGKTYEHDVIIRLSGEVVKRKKAVEEVLRHLARALGDGRDQSLPASGNPDSGAQTVKHALPPP